jgi:hypothetical protein
MNAYNHIMAARSELNKVEVGTQSHMNTLQNKLATAMDAIMKYYERVT